MADGRSVEAFIAVGSNIEPLRNVPAALDMLLEDVRVTGVSTMYRTAPLGRPEQPAFVNGVWRVETALDARKLKFTVLRGIEARLGRVRTEDAFAARPIDLDIALFGGAVIDEPDLVVPDPDVRERAFLAVPLVELAPELRLPGSGVRLADEPVCRDVGGLEPLPELTDQLRKRGLR
jgi:2-amino-4-hydroxy-6-hydroxymethyldihydropteridine diphosphokinase